MPTDVHGNPRGSAGLVDVLDRVFDKGLVVAGDIRVSLAELERLRLLEARVADLTRPPAASGAGADILDV